MLKGHSYFSAMETLKNFSRELHSTHDASIFTILKSYKKGFFIQTSVLKSKMKGKGYFIPEVKYFQLHPINKRYSSWIDDKVSLRYTLAPFKEFLPDYYYLIEKKKIYVLPDHPVKGDVSLKGILRLLKDKKVLACKPISSTEGTGFEKLEFNGVNYLINNKIISEGHLIEHLKNLPKHCISEYVVSSDQLKKINPLSTSTVRLVTLRQDNKTHVVAAFLTFGTKASGSVDNIDKGGVSVAVDVKTGQILPKALSIDKDKDIYVPIMEHPDSKEKFEGQLEAWPRMIKAMEDIGDYLPQLTYMGCDVAITNEGFKIIEINSLQEFINLETYFDVPVNKMYKEFFNRLFADLDKKKKEHKLQKLVKTIKKYKK